MTAQLVEQLRQLVSNDICEPVVAKKFLQRADEGKLTRDENAETHFCVYFAALDPQASEVFIGHHKKSGLWLFNGGHIDEGESPKIALDREMGEEWGLDLNVDDIGNPSLLTITPIYNPTKQPCRAHYDIWYFVSVNRATFYPEKEKLDKEFHETRWLNTKEARKLVIDLNTLRAIKEMDEKVFIKA